MVSHRNSQHRQPSHKRLTHQSVAIGASCLFTVISLSAPVLADDTEVFFGQRDQSSETNPNVLFVMDTSGSMEAKDGTSNTRLERMKEALHTIVDNSANVNIGLMRFNGSYGGGPVLFPITPIDQQMCGESCDQVDLVNKIRADKDDIEEMNSSGYMFTNGYILSMSKEGGAGTEQTIGLRFDKFNVPQGANITSAKVVFTARNAHSEATDLSITAEQSDDSPEFLSTAYDASSRTQGSSVNWQPGPWSGDQSYQTPDISNVLQEVVDRSGWCGGNAISILVQGSGRRDAKSYRASSNSAPTLRVSYDVSGIPASGGCSQKSIVAAVQRTEDDAEERVSNGKMSIGSSDLELPRDGSRQQMVGIRFSSLAIPQGALIDSAAIVFQVDEKRNGSISMRIFGENVSQSKKFEKINRDISDRSLTGSSVAWSNLPELDIGKTVTTPDLSTIVQQIVNRGDWQPDNAMSFVLKRESGWGRRVYESRDGDQAGAPKLQVSYIIPSGSFNPESGVLTAREVLKSTIDDLKTRGGTPIVDAYYEAAQYFKGGPVDYGKSRGYYKHQNHRLSHPDSYTGGILNRPANCSAADLGNTACKDEIISGAATYISPMISSCQTNQIVILSDGAPTSNSAVSKIKAMKGSDACSSSGTKRCGVTLAQWLNETDHSSLLADKQNITTHTIGFNFSGEFLEDLAMNGGGAFYEADSAEELVTAFQSILSDVLAEDSSFVAPGATVNQFNRLTHRSDIYFALFKPSKNPTWDGNLKRYFVGKDTNTDEVTIQDVNGASAVDPATGYFRDSSRSWWRDGTDENGAALPDDGNVVAWGGAAGKQQLENIPGIGLRRVFTYTGVAAIPASGIDLTLGDHSLAESNTNISATMLGIAGISGSPAEKEAYRQTLLRWSRGVDVRDENSDGNTTDVRKHMGDPMHARPIIVNYAEGSPTKSIVFVATNEGFLHAIDSESGHEQYAFIPPDLLPNLNDFFDNKRALKHPYGLDGSLSMWTEDTNENVMIDSGEEAYIYAGMRRGGSNYYALDISNRLNPRLAWVIKGGAGGTPGFEELGETWSRPVPAKIAINGSQRQVVIFSAGYSETQDTAPVRSTDDVGRGIFIVDARTGSLLYAVSKTGGNQQFPDMDYSMPSDIRIIDIDFDGIADQMYVGDMGGQVWRFDFALGHSSGDLLTGGVIASLAGAGPADARRFFYEPDVALIAGHGKRFLSVSIGSGWRAHPLDKAIDDRFYMLQVADIYAAPAGYGKESSPGSGTYVPMTESDLAAISLNQDAYDSDHGWFLNLPEQGQKVLAQSVTFDNKVVFSTYKPDLNVAQCSPAIGGGSVYVVNILDGAPATDLDGDGDIDADDLEKNLNHAAIPPSPSILITEGGPIMTIGPESIDFPFPDLTPRTFWSDMGAKRFTSAIADSE